VPALDSMAEIALSHVSQQHAPPAPRSSRTKIWDIIKAALTHQSITSDLEKVSTRRGYAPDTSALAMHRFHRHLSYSDDEDYVPPLKTFAEWEYKPVVLAGKRARAAVKYSQHKLIWVTPRPAHGRKYFVHSDTAEASWQAPPAMLPCAVLITMQLRLDNLIFKNSIGMSHHQGVMNLVI